MTKPRNQKQQNHQQKQQNQSEPDLAAPKIIKRFKTFGTEQDNEFVVALQMEDEEGESTIVLLDPSAAHELAFGLLVSAASVQAAAQMAGWLIQVKKVARADAFRILAEISQSEPFSEQATRAIKRKDKPT